MERHTNRLIESNVISVHRLQADSKSITVEISLYHGIQVLVDDCPSLASIGELELVTRRRNRDWSTLSELTIRGSIDADIQSKGIINLFFLC